MLLSSTCLLVIEWNQKKWLAPVIFGYNGLHAASISHRVQRADDNVISACESIDQWLGIPRISCIPVCSSIYLLCNSKIVQAAKIGQLRLLTGHIGSNDSELSPNHINAIQSQMQSKGGYEMNSLRIQVNESTFQTLNDDHTNRTFHSLFFYCRPAESWLISSIAFQWMHSHLITYT